MADGPRIVIVGAGGWVFPLELTRDILSFPALDGSDLAPTTSTWLPPSAPPRRPELIGIGGSAMRVEVPVTCGRRAAPTS